MNTERKALCWLFVIVAVVVLALLLYSAGDAQSINQREWLLEYEQVSGYPAPPVKPTATYYASGYPAPALEPTAKPKKQEPKPTEPEPMPLPTATVDPNDYIWDLLCKTYPEISWCVDPSTRDELPYLMPLPTPTEESSGNGYPAPTEETPDNGYPAPTEEPPGNGYPAPPGNGYPAPTKETPDNGYPAPGE